jgi:hypothetical protein
MKIAVGINAMKMEDATRTLAGADLHAGETTQIKAKNIDFSKG